MSFEPSLDDPRFSREFRLPGNTIEGRADAFKITYADYGYRNEENPHEENVFLFFPPLLGSRWMHTAKDHIAKQHKIRIINVERPGYGGTDEVEVQDRLQVWQAAIPALLAHLSIKYVSVGCHSAGTVYALDFILHHPQLLHPERGYLAIAGPWIPPTQSGVISMRIAQSLPAAVIGQSETWARFMKSTVNPALGVGVSAVSSLFGVVARSIGAVTTPADADPDAAAETDGDMEMRLRPTLISKAYGENLQGMGVDAVLMMHAGAGGWSDWGDYEAYVPRLVEALRAAGRQLTVDAFHAETDSMVGDYGEQGPAWFDACWARERCGDGVIAYSTSGVEGADHDLVWGIKFGVPGQVFAKIALREGQEINTPKDPAVESEKPAAVSEDSLVEIEKPAAASEEPVVQSKPVLETEFQVVEPEKSVAEPNTTVVEPEHTVVGQESSAAEPDKPAAVEQERSTQEPETPAVESEKSFVELERPTADSENPVAKPENPVAES
ncbi:hypothetical protein ISF_05037 [Cordyceps fumosorosea ARSEF 2679]|uniref:AB hydrolase-1 domain-containing protein n=1 Tax=Cordyceps fumosorosea (strain ARSEF 2679) TaxID=1081104 RepID=A0A167VZX8_CORFA|nr:hypothetical protein ISF_05037 [Cordyceps fumosorosea ARSEF 2679]OAA63161.1 hypothetical protein ISF_05037 [Cordyceps fumosorosea ARSEF 2679]